MANVQNIDWEGEGVLKAVDDMLAHKISVLSMKANKYETERSLGHWSIWVDEQHAWYAMHNLSGTGFKMWMWLYLTTNAGKVSAYSYEWMDDRIALEPEEYREGFAELVRKGYLVTMDVADAYAKGMGIEVPKCTHVPKFVFIPESVKAEVPHGKDGARFDR